MKQFTFYLIMMACVASAQTDRNINVFFGFDFILAPITVKWACGGARDQDLTALKALISAFPEDAKRADLQGYIDDMLQVPVGQAGLVQILGNRITDEQSEQLCNAARPLSIVWATPQQLMNEDNDRDMPEEQRKTWAAFWQVIENI
ncbi:hypothetical protein [Pseudaestuariivita rosea]|uniref:hypothetical protein n=1 Tax=Pseudaestuariivita rosea TaxID=2763263 RepID=UPI001ABBC028|nr:hypothetical protein [Pseudaestuariivita rosea]